jgi:hypothetical protein
MPNIKSTVEYVIFDDYTSSSGYLKVLNNLKTIAQLEKLAGPAIQRIHAFEIGTDPVEYVRYSVKNPDKTIARLRKYPWIQSIGGLPVERKSAMDPTRRTKAFGDTIFQEFKTCDEAIANLKTWAAIGFPEIQENQLWSFVPTLHCDREGTYDGVECHAFDLKFTTRGFDRQYFQLVPSDQVRGKSKAEAFELFIRLMESRNWELGFFDLQGVKI